MDISFDDFNKSVDALTTMPALKSLYISMTYEDQVDLIMRKLPRLEYLNGLPVDRDGFEEEAVAEASAINAIQKEAMRAGTTRVQEVTEDEESDDQNDRRDKRYEQN